jgi:hypothetical protein
MKNLSGRFIGLTAVASLLCSVAFSQAKAPASLTKHVLKVTYFTDSVASAHLSGGGNTPLDTPTTIVCPGTTGTCMIRADALVLLGQSGSTGNVTCTLLDIDNVDVGCPQTGEVGTAFAQFPSSVGFTVSPGSHTVQTWVFVLSDAELGGYQITYRLYKP